jgi:hypothetical protein
MPMGDRGIATGCDICTHVVIANLVTLKLRKYQSFSSNCIMHFQVSTYELQDSIKDEGYIEQPSDCQFLNNESEP